MPFPRDEVISASSGCGQPSSQLVSSGFEDFHSEIYDFSNFEVESDGNDCTPSTTMSSVSAVQTWLAKDRTTDLVLSNDG